MARKGKKSPRSTKAIAKGYYPIGLHATKNRLNKKLKELNQKVDNLNQKVNKIIIMSLQFSCKDSKRLVVMLTMFKSNIVGLQNTVHGHFDCSCCLLQHHC